MSEVKLNRKLYLLTQIEGEKGTIYIYSAPISKDIFNSNFLILSRAYAALYSHGLGPVAGPRVSVNLIKQEAEAIGEQGKIDLLMAEIRRLTTAIIPSENGYEPYPYVSALQRDMIDEDAIAEIEGSICFFILISCMAPRSRQKDLMEGLNLIWGAQTTSSTISELVHSLPTLMKEENIGKKQTPLEQPQLSIPS